MPLYAGIAETDITPPPGVWMCGYAFRPTGCAGVRDPLSARAIVLDDGQSRIAIVSMDLLGLDFDLVERVRQLVVDSAGLVPHAVLLNATHTHGGPNVRSFNTMGERDPAYIDVLVRKLAGVIRQAADHMEPASIAYGTAPVQIGINRRQYPRAEGGAFIGRNYAGPVDTRVQALVVRDSRQAPRAMLFSHACHPTTVSGDNLLITADFPGAACSLVRREMGESIVPLFLQACCGNINPSPRGAFEHVERHGAALGEAALQALGNAVPITSLPLSAEEVTIALPLIAPPPVYAIQENLDYWGQKIQELEHQDRPGHLLHAQGMCDYYRKELEIAHTDPMPLSSDFTLQRVRMGDLQVLGMPAEMFVQYQLDFERQSSGPLLALGYTNGVHGYVPVAADYPYGGYEVDGANRYYGTLMYTPECEPAIRGAAYELLGVADPDFTAYSILAE